MDMFSTDVMLGVIEQSPTPPSFLLDTFFPRVQTEESAEIHFDVVKSGRKVAPFVSPKVAGKVLQQDGYTTKTFQPAYVKPKHVLAVNQPLVRSPGERIGGNLAPMDRRRLALANQLLDDVRSIRRRKELMAAEAIRTGKITVAGDLYPTVEVDFGRDAALTLALTNGNRIGDTDVNPFVLLNTWHLTVLEKSGRSARDVCMTTDVWNVLYADEAFRDALDTRNITNASAAPDLHDEEGGVYQGTAGGFRFWTYAGWYVDDAGASQPIFPAKSLFMAARGAGIQAHGAIQDERAGYVGVEYFPTSWLENDPPLRMVMTQSAPLVVPTYVDSTLFVGSVIA
jgi:hypothetical protein